MLSIIFLIVLSLFGQGLCAPAGPVFKLTDTDFDHFLKDKETMLVDFYAPWCSDCAKLKPDFEGAARDFARKGKFVFAKIDCFGEGRSICENRFNVHSWPQLKVFRKGQYAGEYSGNQDKASIERFMNELIKQKIPSNIVQDDPTSNQPDGYPCGPTWTQNGWNYSQMSPCNVPYQNPPGWKRG